MKTKISTALYVKELEFMCPYCQEFNTIQTEDAFDGSDTKNKNCENCKKEVILFFNK